MLQRPACAILGSCVANHWTTRIRSVRSPTRSRLAAVQSHWYVLATSPSCSYPPNAGHTSLTLESEEETAWWRRDAAERAEQGEAPEDGEDGAGIDETEFRRHFVHLLPPASGVA